LSIAEVLTKSFRDHFPETTAARQGATHFAEDRLRLGGD
jgi:hypothetical protein